MQTIDKVAIVVVIVSISASFIFWQKRKEVESKYKEVVEENKTMREAIEKPAIIKQPSVIYRYVVKSEDKSGGDGKIYDEKDIEAVKKEYEESLREIERRWEVEMQGGEVKIPIVPSNMFKKEERKWIIMGRIYDRDGVIGVGRGWGNVGAGGEIGYGFNDKKIRAGIWGMVRF